jgi:chaperonin GroES
MASIRKFKPLFNRILVERFLPETKTKSGLFIPEKAQGTAREATVLAVGPGERDKVPMCV